jgi:hypothetical protein
VQLAKSRLKLQILSARKSLPAVRTRDWRARREIIVIWDCGRGAVLPQLCTTRPWNGADTPRIDRGGSNLEHDLKAAGNR